MENSAKVLTHLDVERRFSSLDVRVPALPTSEGCHSFVLQAEDAAGNLWNFGCKIQPGIVPELLIVSSWIQFVRSKDLRSGDIVVLYKEGGEGGAKYKIQVKEDL